MGGPSGLFNNENFHYNFGSHALRPVSFSRRARRCGSRVLPLEFLHLLFSQLLASDLLPAASSPAPFLSSRPAVDSSRASCVGRRFVATRHLRTRSWVLQIVPDQGTATATASRSEPQVHSKAAALSNRALRERSPSFTRPALQRPASVFFYNDN